MVGGAAKPQPPVLANSTVSQSVEKCVQAMVLALELMGFRSEGYKTSGTISFHVRCVELMGGDWMRFYKYKLAAFIAVGLDQEDLPTPPKELDGIDKADNLLGGKAGMFLKMVRVQDPWRWQEIIATLMTVKRAFPRPGTEKVREEVEAAFKALTRKLTRPLVTLEEIRDDMKRGQTLFEPKPRKTVIAERLRELLVRRDLVHELERTVDEIFKGKNFTFENMIEPFFPSTNANYLTTRSQGGAIGHIMTQGVLKGLSTPNKKLVKEEVETVDGIVRTDIDDSSLTEKHRQLIERLLDLAMEEEKKVTLVGLEEALKVRVISKGPVCTYTALKPLQRWLWQTLKDHKSGVFKLISEEISAEYLSTQLGTTLHDGERMLSGDYKAATDNLAPWASEAVTKRIGVHIKDRRIRQLFTQALTGHTIVNPQKGGEGSEAKQTWGQLMGSIVSFPVLCIVNAAICRTAREQDQERSLTLDAAKIAVNGDDCAFRATAAGKVAWENVARLYGMEPSLGKCFFSREFVNMNSAQYRCTQTNGPLSSSLQGDSMCVTLERVPFINMGLVVGQGRTTSGKTEQSSVARWGTLNSISKNAQTLINDCSKEDRHRVFHAYLNQNWKMLKGTTLPWFLPEHLGGLGLPCFPEYVNSEGKNPWQPTKLDLRLAAAFAEHGKLPPLRPEGISWKVWDYAQSRYKDFTETNLETGTVPIFSIVKPFGRHDDANQLMLKRSLMGKLCVEAIFTKNFNEIFREERNERNLTLRKVEAAVKRVLRRPDLNKVQPYTLQTLKRPPPVLPEAVFFHVKSLTHLRQTHFSTEDA
jgi:hypothetical protein